jgi:hypothetical protein
MSGLSSMKTCKRQPCFNPHLGKLWLSSLRQPSSNLGNIFRFTLSLFFVFTVADDPPMDLEVTNFLEDCIERAFALEFDISSF